MEPKPKTDLARIENSTCGLVLNNLEDMKTVAQLVLQSGLAPDAIDTAEKVFVVLQTGAEIGLKPMQALNSIMVQKGKPTLWGDAALALVKGSGLCEYCKEYFELKGTMMTEKDVQYGDLIGYPDGLMAVCESKALRDEVPVKSYFSVADAKVAGLWARKSGQGKPMPWSTHPKRMLKYKARAFNLRDNFPDVLFGMHLTEEMYGEEPLPAPESDVKPRDERRMAVPSTAVDTTRKPVDEKKEVLMKELDEATDAALKTKLESEEKQATIKGVPIVYETPMFEEEKPAEQDLAGLYVDVNRMYCDGGGKDFFEFAAYVLCLDDDEVSPAKLTEEQLRQIKAYILTNGVEIA